MNSYDLGDLVRLTATFAVSGTNTDPTTTTFKLRSPSGTITTYVYGVDGQLVRQSPGTFHVDWSVTEPGVHRSRWVGTGAAQAAQETAFDTSPSAF